MIGMHLNICPCIVIMPIWQFLIKLKRPEVRYYIQLLIEQIKDSRQETESIWSDHKKQK